MPAYAKIIEHNPIQITNWFIGKGIDDEDVRLETMGNFCIENGMKIKRGTKKQAVINFCQSQFKKFILFADTFLKENNYVD